MLRNGRGRIGAVAVLLLTGAAAFVVTASTPRQAAATCSGAGQPFVVTRYDGNGTAIAVEGAPYPGSTCNNDYVYSGLLLDPITDGSCAYAYYLEPLVYFAQQGVSCTTGAWASYGYTDGYGNNSVFVSVRPSYVLDEWKVSSGY